MVRESFKKVREKEKGYQEMYDRAQKESTVFARQQRAMMKDHMRRTTALLAQPNEVKRLSDLLMLEFKGSKKLDKEQGGKKLRDPDSLSAGADVAVQQALLAQHFFFCYYSNFFFFLSFILI
ncbi:hypothetical protein MAR_028139 [Mya arenaria]|uniref:Uncharacterized protein n=1 Tax=Mya arenaria TaxID=6604 RepID=A0ABY7DG85_MYAAR|nr:hypothetical protein MAR_028139 [Mya arenaria]